MMTEVKKCNRCDQMTLLYFRDQNTYCCQLCGFYIGRTIEEKEVSEEICEVCLVSRAVCACNDKAARDFEEEAIMDQLNSPKHRDVLKLFSDLWFIYDTDKWRVMTVEEQMKHD